MEQEFNIPTILVIFGGTGDLTAHKLIPALYNLDKQGMLPDHFLIVPFARTEYTTESYLELNKAEFIKNHEELFDKHIWNRFSKRIEYFRGDFDEKKNFEYLYEYLEKKDSEQKLPARKIFYLAINPDQFGLVINNIKSSGLHKLCEEHIANKVIIEKPFGRDLASFQALNNEILSVFEEEQVLRIDHFLGKETVQNIIYFRSVNPAFFNQWRQEYIERIRISVFESVGIGSRGGYFDNFGQLRDMVQSHLLQLLALVLMDVPMEVDQEIIKQNKASVLNSLYIEDVARDVIVGQYSPGVVNGESVKGYLEEANIKPDSSTDTFVKIKAKIKDARWNDLEIELASGKRMPYKLTEIAIDYRNSSQIRGMVGDNKLIFRIQPSEGITLHMKVKKPGSDQLETVEMKFDYKEKFQTILPEAYEKILLDAIRNLRGNFLSTEELEASWKFVDPILNFWQTNNIKPELYPSGSNKLNE